MATVREIYDFIDSIAPFSKQDSFDNAGLLTGSSDFEVKRVCIALDATRTVVDEAIEKHAELIVTHHPVIFDPLKKVMSGTPVAKMIKNDISFIATHTNYDMSTGCLSDIMAEKLGFSGDEVFHVMNSDGTGYGKIIRLNEPVSPAELAQKCKKAFGTESLCYVDGGIPVKTLALCSGGGNSEVINAIDKGVDALVSGDISWSKNIEAFNANLTLINAGHFYTEIIMCEGIKKQIGREFPELDIFIAENSTDVLKYI